MRPTNQSITWVPPDATQSIKRCTIRESELVRNEMGVPSCWRREPRIVFSLPNAPIVCASAFKWVSVCMYMGDIFRNLNFFLLDPYIEKWHIGATSQQRKAWQKKVLLPPILKVTHCGHSRERRDITYVVSILNDVVYGLGPHFFFWHPCLKRALTWCWWGLVLVLDSGLTMFLFSASSTVCLISYVEIYQRHSTFVAMANCLASHSAIRDPQFHFGWHFLRTTRYGISILDSPRLHSPPMIGNIFLN
jgi:hypothetical protein